MVETERNLCREAGCDDACCYGSNFQIPMSEKKILKFFPDAKKISIFHSPRFETSGVYYIKSSAGKYLVRMVGECEHHVEKGCDLEEKPPDCENLVVGSDACVTFRRAQELARKGEKISEVYPLAGFIDIHYPD